MSEAATGVRYQSADSYYASHTMAQVKDNGVMVALYMNGEPIPQLHGFPVRILNPGYYGVKQPAWITSIEAIDKPMKDYWEDGGWDCSPPIAADSTFFFPKGPATVKVGEPLKLGGAAFGGTRVARVELTFDGGKAWKEASIVKKMDVDNVWVFWEAELVFPAAGDYLVQARATDVHGHSQPKNDPDPADGTEMIRKVYEVDPLVCPRCGGRMRAVAFLTEYAVVDRIIRHLELTFVAEKPPPAHVFEQVALIVAEESGDYE